ncbi:hypothetical protein ACH42_17205 [Endozoicomonas sp. (ex Bugula neritina AB1)]|nr:hypothetical protein ACH42_17205 [Endozoicomonas sp. (ex Bugula neritina AB1)]
MIIRSTRYAIRTEILSKRQSEILLWIAEGKTQREITLILGISTQAVEYNIRQAKERLQAETATEAVVLCWARGNMRRRVKNGK